MIIIGCDFHTRYQQIAQGSTTVSFGYDSANRRTSLTLPNGIVVSYGYDTASELTGLTYTLGSNTLGNLTYSYDLAGRRTSVGGSYGSTNLPNIVSATAYDAANELSQWGTATPSYDANGNMLSDGTNSYVWNARNQLASMDMSGYSFQYDPFGRRVTKTIIGTTTNFLYDGANPVQEQSGGTAIANLLTGGMDEYFQRTDSAGARSFLADALGSTFALTDSTGTVQASYTYDPFGNTTVVGSSSSTYQFTGRENDGTGLYFYRALFYSPTLERFFSEDPIGLDGGTNLYSYTGDSPTNWTDPAGLDVTIKTYPSQWQPWGHIGLGVNSPDTVGFYPTVTTPIAPGMVGRDHEYLPTGCIIIPTTPDQDRKIKRFIPRRKRDPGKYAGVGRNCTHFVQDALHAAGLPNVPDDEKPEALMHDLKQNFHWVSCSNVTPIL
jgi:RHS repeat-associated protein